MGWHCFRFLIGRPIGCLKQCHLHRAIISARWMNMYLATNFRLFWAARRFHREPIKFQGWICYQHEYELHHPILRLLSFPDQNYQVHHSIRFSHSLRSPNHHQPRVRLHLRHHLHFRFLCRNDHHRSHQSKRILFRRRRFFLRFHHVRRWIPGPRNFLRHWNGRLHTLRRLRDLVRSVMDVGLNRLQ